MSRGRVAFLSVLVVLIVGAHSPEGYSQEPTPQKVYRYCYEVNSKDWYQAQELLWRSELRENPQNEDAWLNLFFAARYGWSEVKGRTFTREALMDSLHAEMGKAIPDSWVYHYLHYYNYGTDYSHLERAYQLAPEEPDLYWELIKWFELSGDDDSRHEFSQKLYESKAITTGILELDCNILASTDPNALLVTNGDNDTYPMWVIQDAKGFRPDVQVLNLHSIFGNRKYLEMSLEGREAGIDTTGLSGTDVSGFLEQLFVRIHEAHPEVPLHIARTVYGGYYDGLADDLHLTGMVLTYDPGSFDVAAVNQRILENELRLDYLDVDWYGDLHISSSVVTQLNLMYVRPFLQLAEQYSAEGRDDASRQWKRRALSVAQAAGREELSKEIKELLR